MAHLESNRRGGSAKLARFSLNRQIRLRSPRIGIWVPLLVTISILVIWELGVRMDVISALYFPPPSSILDTTFKLFAKGTLLEHISATLVRMFWGILIGGGSGLALGLLMGWSRNLRAMMDPFIAAIHPIPKIAILPLIMVIFGVGDASLVIVIALGSFFPMLINTMVGVMHIHPIHFDVALNYQASSFKIFQRIIWPGSMPMILTGLRLALNTTLLLAVAVEMVSAHSGLGAMIWMAWTTMRTEEIYTSLMIITILGIVINYLLNYLTTRLIPWQEVRSS